MTLQLPPTVCLDSAAVRRIREDKKLTQLYVSKVVGVTTDTISRWENNRYPTVKRENAQRLAEALETEVEDILEKAADDGGDFSLESSPQKRHFHFWWLVWAVPIVCVILLLYWENRPPEPSLFSVVAERWIPPFASPGSVIPVYIRLNTDPDLKGYILREHFPAGWKLIEADPPASSLDNEQGTARWIIKPGEDLRLVSYLVKVDEKAALGSMASVAGEVVVGSERRSNPASVRGEESVKVATFHWADLDGDQRIDDGEMLEASDTFDAMKGVHLDWNQLEKIWDSGSYRWDPASARFVPEKSTVAPVPDPFSPSSER